MNLQEKAVVHPAAENPKSVACTIVRKWKTRVASTKAGGGGSGTTVAPAEVGVGSVGSEVLLAGGLTRRGGIRRPARRG